MRTIRPTLPAALALVGTLAACADAPTGTRAPASAPASVAPSFGKTGSGGVTTSTGTASSTTAGDTVVTTFTVGTNTAAPASFNLGNGHRIDFPYASGSICDLKTSSYGAGTWDAPCTASKVAVTVTAKSWFGQDGLPRTDFQPAMRFVPGLRKAVTLYLKDRDQQYAAGQQVLFCSAAGCVDESLADASVKTTYDATSGVWQRPLKHFSGYSVGVGRSSGDSQY